MNTRLRLLLCAFIAAIICAVLPAVAQADIITNGGFETGTFSGWTQWCSSINCSNQSIVTSPTHSGSYAAKLGTTINDGTQGTEEIREQVSVPSGGGALTFWYQSSTTGTAPGSPGPWVYVCYPVSICNIIQGLTANTSGWTQASVNLSPYAGTTAYIRILEASSGWFGTTGLGYFDDITIDGFSITQPTATSVADGEQTTTTVNTSVTSGSAGPVNLAASGAAPGMTITFSPNPVTAGQSSTMTVKTTDPTTPQGTNTPTVTGTETTGSGATVTQTTTESTTVNPPNKFTVAPTTSVESPGGATTISAATTVTSGVPETLTCSVSGVPSGVTYTFKTSQVTAGQPCQATVSAGTSAPASQTTATVTATSTVPLNGNPNGNSNGATDSNAVLAPNAGSLPSNPTATLYMYGLSNTEGLAGNGALLTGGVALTNVPGWDNTALTDLNGLKTGHMLASYARAGWPYDTAGSAYQGTNGVWQCWGNHGGSGVVGNANGYNAVDPHGNNLLGEFDDWLLEVKAQGLQPEVTLNDAYNGYQQNSAYTGPGYTGAENNNGDVGSLTASLGDQVRYACGVYLLLAESQRLGVAIQFFEPWNEPDAGQLGVASQSGLSNETGWPYAWYPQTAAMLWDLADSEAIYLHDQQAAQNNTEPVTHVAAGEMTSMEGRNAAGTTKDDYLSWYINALACGASSSVSCISQKPAYWSLHDYLDVTAYGIAWGGWTPPGGWASDPTGHLGFGSWGTGRAPSPSFYNVSRLESDLATAYGTNYNYSLWITEAGGHLNEADQGYAGVGNLYTCADVDTGDNNIANYTTQGGCLDYQPAAPWDTTSAQRALRAQYNQALSAQGFMALASAGSSNGPVTMALWHGMNDAGGWDSSMLDGSPPPNPEQRRSSYCVLAFNDSPSLWQPPNGAGDSGNNCTGSPADQWATDPDHDGDGGADTDNDNDGVIREAN